MSQQRLLVVEDDLSIASMLQQVASEAGYDTAVATTSEKFMSLYAAFKPDIITLDVLMPDMDGFDVLKYLQEMNCTARIVLISGSHQYRDMASMMAKAQGLCIAGNISKPFRVPDLRKQLKRLNLQASEPRPSVVDAA